MSDNNNNHQQQDKKNNKNKEPAIIIDLFDNLSPEDRKLAIAHFKEHWQSLTPQQKTEHMSELYARARKKIRSAEGMLTNQQAIQE